MAQAQAAAPQRYMQGIAVPATSVRPEEFFARTRRHTLQESSFQYDSNRDINQTIELRKSDILSSLTIRFSGKLTVTPGTGTVATTRRWPYDLLRLVRYTANGASNVIGVSGAKLKMRDIMKKSDLTDRGVVQKVDGADVAHGTLAQAGESWGVGSGASTVPAGTYDVELIWHVPVSEDEKDLLGATFLATSSSSLTLNLDFQPTANLFTLTGDAKAQLAGRFEVTSTKFSIPIGTDGQIVVPDLSLFHSMIESRYTALQNGDNEVLIIGQGAGKSLLRAWYQVWNGTKSAPLTLSDANFSTLAWAFGGAEQPEQYPSARTARLEAERRYNCDVGGPHGVMSWDFAHENTFRDVVDMGTVQDLRLKFGIQNTVSLASPAIEYVTETVYLAGQASA